MVKVEINASIFVSILRKNVNMTPFCLKKHNER